MAAFELYRDYPLAQISEGSSGSWILPGLVKGLSASEAVIFLRPFEKVHFEVLFPSSQVCLVHFHCDKAWPESEAVDQRLRSVKTLWVFVAGEQVATLLRVVSKGISFVFSPSGWFDLTIPLEPSLSSEEWHRLGMTYQSMVTINESETRYISSEQNTEDLCRYLRQLASFWLQASRFEGDELDMSVDKNGAVVDYMNRKQGVKLVSLGHTSTGSDIVRQRIDALPYMELETERRHLIPIESGLTILRAFLKGGKVAGMVQWPVDD